jgi:membrane fusion protein (multidrug efflux system)
VTNRRRAAACSAARAVAVALLVPTLAGCEGGADAAKAPPPIEVGVVRVARQPVTVYDEYVAQTEAPNTIELRSQVTGLLERQVVADGAQVRKGDLLYQIDPKPFQAAVAQAEANLAQAQAALTNAQQTLDRYEELIGQGFISKQAYQNAVAQQRQAAAAVKAQQALLRDARINLGYTRIVTPQDGYLSQSQVRPGALVTAQQTMLNTLYSSDPMYVYFSVSEDRLPALQAALEQASDNAQDGARPFRIQLPDGTEYGYGGELNFVDAAVNERTGTLQARVSVPNPQRALRPGMFVRLRLPSLQSGNALTVPQKAVTELQGLKMVYVVGPDNKPQSRQIVADVRAGDEWVVQKGLAPGEMVVVEGLPKIQLMPNAVLKPVIVAATPRPAAPAAGGSGPPADSAPEAVPSASTPAPHPSAPGTEPRPAGAPPAPGAPPRRGPPDVPPSAG